jgi:hypothetical protein
MTSAPLPVGPDPQTVSRANEAAILAAAAAHPKSPGGEMRVLHEEAFRSTSEGNPYCFMVMGQSGMMGIAGMPHDDGSLGPLTCVAL